jgi:hypothetical protein
MDTNPVLHYPSGMSEPARKPRRRNVTITLEEDVARWARIKAAEQDTSISQLVGDMLKEEMQREGAYAAAMREMFASVKPVKFEKPGGRFPSRDELYDRPKRWS